MSTGSKQKRAIFANKPRRWSADDLLKVAGGGPFENEGGNKSGSGQDNSAMPGFF